MFSDEQTNKNKSRFFSSNSEDFSKFSFFNFEEFSPEWNTTEWIFSSSKGALGGYQVDGLSPDSSNIFLIKQHYDWLRFWGPESFGLKFLAFMTRSAGTFIMTSKPAHGFFFFTKFWDFRFFFFLKIKYFLIDIIVFLTPTSYQIRCSIFVFTQFWKSSIFHGIMYFEILCWIRTEKIFK